ncbi:hypothetical protein FJZ53_03625 [Candidatus Woesearchaeota archaeon]|nr:hypothetical protein [Candidatus Woesearchaeota archaeon]
MIIIKKGRISFKTFQNSFLIIVSLVFFFYFLNPVIAASYDQDLGTWTEVYENGTDVSSNSSVALDASDGTLKLINSSGDFGPPYATSGYLITTTIMPTSVAQWSNITFDSYLPDGTNATIQVLDEYNHAYSNTYLSGNSNGLSSPANISSVPVEIEMAVYPENGKFARLSLKILLTTSDTDVTPIIDNITLSWIVSQGNLTASALANTSWPTTNVDKKGTRHTVYYADPVYPALRWAKSLSSDYGGRVTRGTGDVVYSKTFGYFDAIPGKLSALNRTTGATIWTKSLSGNSFTNVAHTLSENGGLYVSDQYHDIFLAYDISDGSLRWTYQFGTGHSTCMTTIGDDGTIYTTRVDGTFSIYAFYPNSSVKWINTTYPPSDSVTAGQIVLNDEDALYISTLTYSGSDYTGGGELYAFNTSDGSPLWEYATGDSYVNLVVDADGTLYTAQTSNNYSNLEERQMYAIYPNGSLKWSRSIGLVNDSWYQFSLRSDGVLLAERSEQNLMYSSCVEAINTTDGSLLWNTNNVSSISTNELFSDGQDGFYFRSNGWSGSSYTNTSLHYYDSNNNKKWEFYTNGNYYISYLAQDEDGRVYGTIRNYGSAVSTLFSLWPWTLSVSTSSDIINSSDQITFTANTSMKSTNLISGDLNKVQVVMDYGEKIALTYDSDLDENVSVWTANYTIPSNTTTGNHTFTLEAGAAGIQTDITTSFDSPATNSGNTGINVTGSFNVTDGSSPEITLDYPSDGLETSSDTIGMNFTVTELYLDTCELWGNWSDWHLNQSYDGFLNGTTQNFTNVSLPEGDYIWNVWCNDTSSNTNFSASNYTFRIDTTAPSVNLQNPVDSETWTGSSVTFTYQVSDISSISSCELYINGSQNSTSSSISKDTNQTFSSISLFNDKYEWYVKCTDGAGNSANSATRYLTQACTESWSCTDWSTCSESTQIRTCTDTNNCPAQANKPAENQSCGGGGTGGGGGGGGGGGAGGAVSAFDIDFSIQRTRSLRTAEGTVNSLSFDGVTRHTIKVTKVSLDSATVTITSEPVTATIKVGETVTVDLNKDGIMDLGITLEGVTGTSADMVFEKLTGADVIAEEDTAASKQKFSLSKKEIRMEVTQGETVQESFRIKNDGTETLILNLEISDDLKSYIVLSKDVLALGKGEDKNIDVNFLAPATLEPGTYTGRIIIKTKLKELSLPLQMTVKKREALFDVKVKIPEKFKKVYPGESVVADVTLLNIGKIGQVDVDVYYTIKDQEGIVVTFSKETVGVEVAASFTKTLTLPEDVTVGNYTFFVNITYKDTSTTGEDYFLVKREIPIIPRFIRGRFYELLVWVVGGLLLLVIFFVVRERHLKKIIKEVKGKEEKDIKRLEVREKKLERALSKIRKREKK